MVSKHILKLFRKTPYNQSKRRICHFYFTLQYYSLEFIGLKLEIKFYFICSFILAGSGTNNSGSGSTILLGSGTNSEKLGLQFCPLLGPDGQSPFCCSLLSIYQQRCSRRQQDHHTPISRYYERLNAVQARGSQASHQVSTSGILKALRAFSNIPTGTVPTHSLVYKVFATAYCKVR